MTWRVRDLAGRGRFLAQHARSKRRPGVAPAGCRNGSTARRLSGDLQQAQSQVAAAVRADNARRLANGQRVRFRFSGGRVALTDWLLGGELARLEAEAHAAVERYREASRARSCASCRSFQGTRSSKSFFWRSTAPGCRKSGPSVVRDAGGEAHFSAVQKPGTARSTSALVIRRDGREIGRERVADLRGSLHHYGPASAGWMVTRVRCSRERAKNARRRTRRRSPSATASASHALRGKMRLPWCARRCRSRCPTSNCSKPFARPREPWRWRQRTSFRSSQWGASSWRLGPRVLLVERSKPPM